jgi:ABC-type nitrate/sulfonate/bicarbonate transport system substrate-binding protein
VIRDKLRAPSVALATVCLVAACGGGASPSPSPAASQAASPGASSEPSPSPSPIPVEDVAVQLDFNISASSGALLWGIDQGIFEKYGINLDIIVGEGSDLALQQIDAGNVDFAYIDGSNYTAARVQGVTETTAIYALQNISTTGIASKEEINDPEDMIGKSFGTVAQSSGRQKIPLVLEMNDVDAAQVPIELMDFSVLYPSLFQDVIDTAEVGMPGQLGGRLHRRPRPGPYPPPQAHQRLGLPRLQQAAHRERLAHRGERGPRPPDGRGDHRGPGGCARERDA